MAIILHIAESYVIDKKPTDVLISGIDILKKMLIDSGS